LAADEPGTGGEQARGFRERLSNQAEDAIGRLADDLLENPVINSALQRALGAREKMAQAQESAMGALNLPSASNLDKLARRLRSISQRLDEIEDGVERLDRRVEAIGGPDKLEQRLERLDARLDELGRELGDLRRGLASQDALSATQASATIPEG
jgi:hypothetical protein